MRVMRGHDNVSLLFQQQPLHGVVEDVLGDGDVESGERVVQEESVGRRVDGASQGDAGLLTARYVGAARADECRVFALHLRHIVTQGARLQYLAVTLGVHLTAEQDVVP